MIFITIGPVFTIGKVGIRLQHHRVKGVPKKQSFILYNALHTLQKLQTVNGKHYDAMFTSNNHRIKVNHFQTPRIKM